MTRLGNVAEVAGFSDTAVLAGRGILQLANLGQRHRALGQAVEAHVVDPAARSELATGVERIVGVRRATTDLDRTGRCHATLLH